MAIVNNTDFPIDPNSVSGTDLADRLNRQYAAVASQFLNTSRSATLTTGAVWARNMGDGTYRLNFFDGTKDNLIGSTDSTGAWQLSSAPLAAVFSTATSYKTGDIIFDRATNTYREAKNDNGPGAFNAGDWQTITNPLAEVAKRSGDNTFNGVQTILSTGQDTQLFVRNTGTALSDDCIIALQTSSTGTTSTISGIYFGDGDSSSVGQIRYNHSNDSMHFYTGATFAASLSAAGNFGVGVSNPAYNLVVQNTGTDIRAQFRNSGTAASDDCIVLIQTSTTGTTAAEAGIYFGDGDSVSSGRIIYTHGDDNMAFRTNATERMRIAADSFGSVLFGKTAVDTTTAGIQVYTTGVDYGRMNFVKATASGTGSTNSMVFYYNGTPIGSITNTSTTTGFNQTSDYRLKMNVEPLTGAIARLAALKPSRFNWIAEPDENKVDGFIAHEAQKVVPEAVTGEKDAVDEDGNILPQGIDQAKLVPLLTAALQEAIAKIDALETRLAALEAK